MKSDSKKLVAEAEKLGYVETGVNGKGFLIYTHPNGHEVRINPSGSEFHAREMSKAMRRACGQFEAPRGRNANAVKDRQCQRRELDAERIAAERRENQAQRDAILARRAMAPLIGADRDALRALEQRARELHELEVLMKSTSASGHHQGRVSHTAGTR